MPTRSNCSSSSDHRLRPILPVCGLLVLFALITLIVPVAARAGVTPQEPVAETPPPTDPVCEPSPEVADVLAHLQEVRAECGLSTDCQHRQEAILEDALEQHPGNLHLTREAQDLWQSFAPLAEADPAGREERLEVYRRNAEEHPDSAEALYLYGRFVADPKEALQIFQNAVAVDPGYPWSHLGAAAMQARLSSAGAGVDDADREAFEHHIGAFLDRCPARLPEGSSMLRYVNDKDFWSLRAERGRAALESMGLERALDRYPALWRILYASRPIQRHDEVDPMVRADLKRIEALDLEASEVWWEAQATGYEMLGDEEAENRVRAARMEQDPCGTSSVFERSQRWTEEHPAPAAGAPEAEQTAHMRLVWDTAGSWIESCPDAAYFWQLRLSAAKSLDDLPADDVLRTVDRLVELSDSAPYKTGTPLETQIAQVYVEHDLRLDRVHDLAEEGLAEDLAQTDMILEQAGVPEDMKAMVAQGRLYSRWQALQLETKAAVGLERPEEARELLVDLRALADDHRPGEDADARSLALFQALDEDYWDLRADLANLEEQPMDAAVFRTRAATLIPDDGDKATEKRQEARDAWIQAGGSEEAWQALLEGFRAEGGPAPDRQAVLWSDENLPLPEFELADLSGGTWTRSDLEGKTVFANVWATWCGPCREELPLVEELHERLADRDDVAVVTLNIDTNPALAVHFMEKEGYTFPVLQADSLVTGIGKNGVVPRSWILDPSVVLRRERIGFGKDEGWVDGVIGLLDEIGGTPASTD